jgi:hypothetical protein
MIVVRLEMWPHGDESRKYNLASAQIVNVGGTASSGDYLYYLFNKAGKPWRMGTVKRFPRKRLMAFDLLFRVLNFEFGRRNA